MGQADTTLISWRTLETQPVFYCRDSVKRVGMTELSRGCSFLPRCNRDIFTLNRVITKCQGPNGKLAQFPSDSYLMVTQQHFTGAQSWRTCHWNSERKCLAFFSKKAAFSRWWTSDNLFAIENVLKLLKGILVNCPLPQAHPERFWVVPELRQSQISKPTRHTFLLLTILCANWRTPTRVKAKSFP